jgi:hypothetical protein
MGRGDKIDVVAALFLQREHDIGQFLERNLCAFSEMADRIILAEQAAEIAVAHEDSPGAKPAHQRLLFTKMRAIA